MTRRDPQVVHAAESVSAPPNGTAVIGAGPFTLEALSQRIAARSGEETSLDALRDWMASTIEALTSETPDVQRRFWQERELHSRGRDFRRCEPKL